MMFKPWITAATLLLSPLLIANPISTQMLTEVSLSEPQLNAICQQLPRCDADSASFYEGRNAEYYFIDESPQIARFTKTATYQLKQRWDFADYQHESEIHEGAYGQHLYIEPKLYPLNQTQWGIAIVKYGFGAYSGGGIREERADIIQLNDDGSYQTALKDIPFYYESMIRACFWEEDADSPHCHDEDLLTTAITYQDIGKPYYQWEITYTSTYWSAHVPKSQALVQEEKEQRVPFESLNKRSDP